MAHCAVTLELGRMWRALGCSSVQPQMKIPQIKIRCRQLCLLVNMKPAVTEINCKGTVRHKRISAAADKPWYITMMNGFINALLNMRSTF